jgi:hypothetical protein
VPPIGRLMAPGLVNGCLAVLGFMAAVGTEVSTGQGVFSQLGEALGPILISFTTFARASLLPHASNLPPQSRANGFLFATAEMLNGRAAYTLHLIVRMFCWY